MSKSANKNSKQKFTTPLNKGCGSGYNTSFLTNQPATQMQFTTTTSQIRYHNLIDTTVKIFNEEGIMGFFSGLKMRIAIQSFSSAIAWGTYQVVKSTLDGKPNILH
jgi:hypothetical protein